MNSLVTIIIAAHKQYRMPDDPVYLPLHVGAEGKKDLGYTRDNTGENISELNSSFCELTGLYWAWKNIDSQYIGLVHYRRHFSLTGKADFEHVLTGDELVPLLKRYKVIVPRKRHYYIESLYSHYAHTHYASHLDDTRKIIAEKYLDYLQDYDRTIRQTSGHMFNMMIMEKELLSSYCEWLFDILFSLKQVVNAEELDAFQARYPGRISEIIFNVWLDHNIRVGTISKDQVKEIPTIHMEKINWLHKGSSFLKAKFFGKRYGSSF